MIYREEQRDLFSVDKSYALVHCISADFKMGAGIAVVFTSMGVKAELFKRYPTVDNNRWNGHGYCLKTTAGKEPDRFNNVYNLITKPRYFDKPTYETLKDALLSLREQCIADQTKKIAMPYIGCGLDRLNWQKVSEMLKSIFGDTDIEILVCHK